MSTLVETADQVRAVRITRRTFGHAHCRFEGTAPAWVSESDIAFACDDRAPYFGWRDFTRDGERFAVTVHTD